MRRLALLLLCACGDPEPTASVVEKRVGAPGAAAWSGEDATSRFGYALAVGDLDDDGWDDLVVGAPGYDRYAGRVGVYAGSATGPAATPGVTWDGAAESTFGAALALADLDGDSVRDVVVGAPAASTDAGSVDVYFGVSGSFPTAAGWSSSGSGEAARGEAVALAGDVNADGVDDLVLGEPSAQTNRGRVLVYLGDAAGLDAVATTLQGQEAAEHFGAALAGLGDIDGDGYGDVAAAAPYADGGTGEVRLYGGSPLGLAGSAGTTLTGGATAGFFGASLAVGDEGDGYPDLLVGAPREGAVRLYQGDGAALTEAWTLLGADAGAEDDESFGWAVAWAGDTNGDGTEDVAIGGPFAASYAGAVTLLEGGSATTNRVYGENADDGLGGAVTPAGDVDGDGYADLFAAADTWDAGAGRVYLLSGYRDEDLDGSAADVDCDETDATVYPGAPEVVGDGVDQDCDAGDTCEVDADDDGHRPDGGATVASADLDCDDPGEALPAEPGGDCDDTDAATWPGAPEVTGDEVDQDCDGGEACYADADGDAWRVDSVTPSADADCTDAGEAAAAVPGGDCNDADAATWPGAPEVTGDEVDQSCDGAEDCWTDTDLDGWRADRVVTSADVDCVDPGEAASTVQGLDCDDDEPTTYPGAVEGVGDEVDSDCDAAELCLADADGDAWHADGAGQVTSADADCRDAGESPAAQPGDCNDADPLVYPGAPETVGDEVDQDCDGGELCQQDADGDEYASVEPLPSADTDCDDAGERDATAAGGDCDDADPAIHPGAEELLGDEVDQDCDGAERCAVDQDGDGHADPALVGTSADTDCADAGEATAAAPADDCDDTRGDTFPGADDLPGDGIDQDCDGADAEKTPTCGCAASPGRAAAPWPLWSAVVVALGALRRLRAPAEPR